MATTLKATAVAHYENGNYYTDGSPVVGMRNGATRVIRYAFTIPSTGASSYSVMISGCSRLDGDCTSLKCYLTTNGTSYARADSTFVGDATLSRRSTTTGYGEYEFYSGTITKNLTPNTTYYLWVFAASTTSSLSMYLPKDNYQYSTNLATITINGGSTAGTDTGTQVSGEVVEFTADTQTDTPLPYRMIVRVKETSSNSTSVTFSLNVYLMGLHVGADYTYTYGNKLEIKVNGTSLYSSSNITNGSYALDVNYNQETSIYSGSFTLTKNSSGIASGTLYVNFCQTQLSQFNATVEETIKSAALRGVVYIDNGTTFEAYQVFIDNGTSWEQYIPYIDNGSSWDVYG